MKFLKGPLFHLLLSGGVLFGAYAVLFAACVEAHESRPAYLNRTTRHSYTPMATGEITG